MRGRLDRIDSVPREAGPVTQLIDYKTGSADVLRALVRQQPQEDTQLAFYAALVAAQSDAGGPIEAAYLPLDERDRVRPIEHANVEASGARLVARLGEELDRVRAGAALPALGEGRPCDFCAARGLCRRDHWPAAAIAA
jgi:ATP-dependent helicase/nuclease subunit B